MKIQVLGSGCKKCLALSDNVAAAAKAEGIDVEIEKVTDIVEVARSGVMSTPGLLIDGDIISTGKVPTVEALREILLAR